MDGRFWQPGPKESAIQSSAFNSSLPLSLPLGRVEAAEWVRLLTPAQANSDGSSWSVESASPPSLLDRTAEQVGAGPAQWAVQVGDQIARFLHRRYPHWASTEAEQRANRVGPESMALVSLEFLATGRFRSGRITVAVEHMMRRSHIVDMPLNELLQSCGDIHSRLAQAYLQACEQLVHAEHHLAAARAISRVLLACAREYTDAIVSQHTRSSAPPTAEKTPRATPTMRRQLVSELLRGVEPHPPDLTNIEKKLAYAIADRRHRAFIAWSNPDDLVEPAQMDGLASELVSRVGRGPILLVDRPTASETWIWCNEPPHGIDLSEVRVPPRLRVASASASRGLAGFRLSHSRATEVRRAAGSFHLPADRVGDYNSMSAVLPFAEDLSGAATFVVEELGNLAAPSAGVGAQRLTLATLLRTQSVSATARELYVTRSTVTYRLQRAKELLPAGWKNRPTEVSLALRLLDLLGPELIFAAMSHQS